MIETNQSQHFAQREARLLFRKDTWRRQGHQWASEVAGAQTQPWRHHQPI